MLALVERIVRDEKRDTALRFDFKELLLHPGKHVAWVLTLSPDVPVKTVALLCIVRQHTRARWHSFSIKELDWHAVVAVFSELFVGLRSQPVLPVLFKVIYFIVDTRS